MPKPEWYPDWSGETCVIVAGGPSAPSCPLDMVRGRAKVVAINNSWRLVPWADVLYACDGQWWLTYSGVPDFSGIKASLAIQPGSGADVRRIADATERFPGINLCPSLRSTKVVYDREGTIGWGSNSGFQALNLCLYLGVKRVVLVGYDMRIDNGKHWHGEHPSPLYNPTAADCAGYRRVIDGAASAFEAHGIEVVNASPISALTAYRKIDFCEYFGIDRE